MDYVSAFIVGGLICVVAQILMDTTKLQYDAKQERNAPAPA